MKTTVAVLLTLVSVLGVSITGGPAQSAKVLHSGTMELARGGVADFLKAYAEESGLELVIASNVRHIKRIVILPPRHGTTWDSSKFCHEIEKALLDQAGVVITHLEDQRVSVTYNDALKIRSVPK